MEPHDEILKCLLMFIQNSDIQNSNFRGRDMLIWGKNIN
jgi:hypothetical protein